MERKREIITTLIMNVFLCAALCLTAQLLEIAQGHLPGLVGKMFCINFCIAYPVATAVGLYVPAPKFAMWVCRLVKVKPGPLFGIVFTLAINIIFTLVLSGVMTFFNAVIIGGQGVGAMVGGMVSSFVPMWMVSSLASGIIRSPIEKLVSQAL